MENEIISAWEHVTVEILVISIIVWALTMFIKWPIKRYTSQMEESRRKAANSVIIFIPLMLAFIICNVYFGMTTDIWFGKVAMEASLSTWLLSFSLNSLFSRVEVLARWIKTEKTSGGTEELPKEAVLYIKENLKTLSKELKEDEKKATKLDSEIGKLQTIKKLLEEDTVIHDVVKIATTNEELKNLLSTENELKNRIFDIKNQIEAYSEKLSLKKEETNG